MLIKIDLLSIEGLDKIHACLDFIAEAGYLDKNKSLREKYEDAIGIYKIERNDPKMWKMVWEHKIQSLFQMEQQSGIQGIALIKPKSVDELAVLNSVIRLMASEKGGEVPLNMWARYRKNINYWIAEMRNYGLTEEEIDWLSHHSAITDGVCESQEGLMSLVQEQRLGGNSLGFADKCRKGIAKKQGKLFEECEEIYYKNIKEQGLSEKLAHYVWDVLLRVQRGYSFNRSHCLAYSLIALQEMNLCYKYPIILWNTACLAVNSGSLEDSSEEEIVDIYAPEGDDLANGVTFQDLPNGTKIRKTASTDYAKLAKAIGDTQKLGIKLSLANINESDFGFKPDIENNQILYGLKGMLHVSDETVKAIIENRPYSSPKDFYLKIKPNKQTMISLIKGGAFDQMMDRKICMGWFLWETADTKSKLTLQNMPTLIKKGMIPKETEEEKLIYSIYEFNRYLKAQCKVAYDSAFYHLDERAEKFLNNLADLDIFYNKMDSLLDIKQWNKFYQKQMDFYRKWFAEYNAEILQDLNERIFMEAWEQYATGNISAWEMESLCFYYHEHELKNIKNSLYGFVNFFDLPEEPIVEKTFKRGGKEIKMFKLFKICGTCIAKNKNKSTVSLLTTDGVVNVKMAKEYFAMFDKRISEKGPDGKKHVIEKSFFDRGSMIVVMGIRRGNDFVLKRYASVPGHELYKIEKVNDDGTLILRHDRKQGEVEEDET